MKKSKKIENTEADIYQRFNLLLDNLNCVAYIVDANLLKPLQIDGSVQSITGYSPEDLIHGSISWTSLIHKDDLKVVAEEREKILHINGYVGTYEYRIFHKNGNEIWLKDIARYIPDEKNGTGTIQGVFMEITQQKITTQTMQTTQVALDAARDSVYWIGPKGTFLYVNNSACESLEYTKDELLNLSVFDIDPLFKKENWQAHWAKTRMFQSYKLETIHQTKSGKIIPVEVSISFIKDGELEFHSAYARDISERKQAEEILKKYQQLLNESQRLSHVGSWELDVTTREMVWSEENFRILGMDGKSFQPTLDEFLRNIHIADRYSVLKNFEDIIQTKCFKDFNFRLTTADGSVKWVHTTGNVYRDETGESSKIFGNLQDITERIKFENELIEKEHTLENIIDFLPDATFVVDVKGKIIAWNKAMVEMTGALKEDMLGKGNLEYAKAFYGIRRFMLIDYIFEKSKDILKSYDYVHLQGATIFSENYNPKLYNGKGGYVRSTAAPLLDNNGKQIGAIESIRDITERVNAERALAESEKKYRLLLTNLPDIVVVLLEGKIVFINDAVTLMGYSIDEVLGTSITKYIHNDDRALVNKYVENRLKNLPVPNLYEIRLITKSGETKYIQVRGALINYEGKAASLHVVTDVTERKLIEQELHASEDKFAKAFYTSPDAININSLKDGKYIEINSGFTALTGFTKEDVIGKSSTDINIWVNSDERKNLINELLRHGEVNNFEATFKIKNGDIKTALMSARLIELNNVICILSITRDITERKIAQQALSNSEAMLQSLVNSLPQNIFCKDLEGRFTFVNQNFCNTEGKSEKEIIGKTDFDFYSENSASKYREDDNLIIETGKIFDGVEIHEVPNGNSFYVRIIKTPMYNSIGEITGILGIFWDITESKKAEEELIDAKNKAEVSEQLKSAFLAQMSHEIRSPLYRILGYISLLKDQAGSSLANSNEDVLEYFSSIDLSSKRLIRTIDSILNMSEIQTHSYNATFSEIDLSELLNGLRKEYLEQANEKRLDLKLIIYTDLTTVSCDEYSVTQIFANLIDNALKYTSKGRVKIIISRNSLNQLYVEVNDTGIGISKEFLDEIFSPFSQEETGYTRKFDGNGLGLALVKSYCDINNASIHVESNKGIGSTFRIIFKNSNTNINIKSNSAAAAYRQTN